jgi:FixJ family two-component response regulator
MAVVNDPVISIIDDDEATRSAVSELMRASGYSAVAYDSAENFLASDASGSSDCIITDIQMPGLTGIELKQRLEAGACATPVIMITARREERLLAQARASGAFCLLRKPFKASALIDCVRRALSHQAGANTADR